MITPKQIKRQRKKAKLSQEYMASIMGVTRQTYAKLEKDPMGMTVKQYVTFEKIIEKVENAKAKQMG